jgi:hypothetical protein
MPTTQECPRKKRVCSGLGRPVVGPRSVVGREFDLFGLFGFFGLALGLLLFLLFRFDLLRPLGFLPKK